MSVFNRLGAGGSVAAGAAVAIILGLLGLVGYDQLNRTPEVATDAKSSDGDAVTVEVSAEVSAEIVAEDAADAKSEVAEAIADAPAAPTFDIVRIDAEGNALIAGTAPAGALVRVLIDGVEAASTVANAAGEFVAIFVAGVSGDPRIVSLEVALEDGTTLASADSVIVQPAAPVVAAADPIAPEAEETAPEVVAVAEPAVDDNPPVVEVAEAAAETASPVVEAAPVETTVATSTADANTAKADEETATIETAEAVQAEVATETTAAAADADVTDTAVAEAEPDVAETAAPTVDAPVTAMPDNEVAEAPKTDSATVDPTPEVVAEAPAAMETAPEQVAPTVILAGSDGMRVLQSGGAEPNAQIVIDTISYDTEGDVALAGRGAGGEYVRVYLDNRPIKTTQISVDGQWEAPLPEVDTGVYTLRVDQVDSDGNVTARTETPFLREEPADLAALEGQPETPAEGATRIARITVQPGNTLWGIARANLGEGVLYVRLFEANKDRIRDPDLIYPGQIFTIPEPQ